MSTKTKPSEEQVEILIVEDSPTQAERLRYILEEGGYRVLVAGDGKQALALLGEHKPASIVTDITMPEMDGYELCRQVKAEERTRDIPVILLTALDKSTDVLEGLACGADNFITKPYNEAYLLSTLHRILVSRELCKSERVRVGMEIVFGDKRRFITADQQQMLTLLLSTYEAAVSKNTELTQTQDELRSLNERLESLVQKQTAKLEELIKELKCLYAISNLVAEPYGSINEALKAAVDLIPPGWQYPEITRARIVFEGREFASASFRDTAWKQSADIVISGETVGTVEVCYLEERPALDAGLFLKEERSLINDIARQLGVMIGRKRVEEALQSSETRYRRLFEAAKDGILILDADTGEITDVNPFLADLLQFSHTELLGRKLWEIGPWGDALLSKARFEELQSKGNIRYENLPLETRDGRQIAVEFVSNVYFVNHHKVIQCNIRDITERKRAEDALQRSEASYRSLIQGATYGIFRCCLDGKFLTVNPALVTMLDYRSEAELLAANFVTDINPDPDKGAQLLEQYRQAGRLDGVEVEWKRKDGKLLAVRLSGQTVLDESGALEGFELIAEDLGERRLLEEQLRQAQKMETVGRLAGGVAHDFNNLLTIISGFSQLLLERLEADDPRRAYVKEIQEAEKRAAVLTRQLLAFGRRQMLLPQVLDLNAVVAKMDKMLRPLLGEDIELVIVLPPDLGRVKADPGQIEQVLLNLAVNARDAMPGGGKLTLETANIDLDESYALGHAAVRTGPYVLLAVSDTGCGMDAETQSHIFEPFFTTKEKGKGTGLGLATSYGIIQQSGGYIWVYSEPGQGTTFKIYLPRVEEVPEPVAVHQAQAGPAVGSETILLVEDEASVRSLVRGVLEARGYAVLEAGLGDEAMLICQQHQGPIHLLLTDVVMPQMTGPVLAERLAFSRPEMRVLYMSGYTDHAVFRNGALQAGTSFLQKPFTPETLAQKVRNVLDETQNSKA